MDRRGSPTDGADGAPEETAAADRRAVESESDVAVSMDGTWRPDEVPEMLPYRGEAADADAFGYAADVRDAAALHATAAADHVDYLVGIVRGTTGDARAAAAEALDLIGRRSPSALAVWTEHLVALATADDPAAAAVGFRALAHLSETHPAAAAAGVDAAVEAARSTDVRHRPALRLVAALAEADPDHVSGADPAVAAAMAADAADVRAAGALCAASVLAAAPGSFPRTASRLFDLFDDADPEVSAAARVALVRFARTHPAKVPEKRRAVEVVGRVTGGDLGLDAGATKDALTALLAAVHGYSF